MTADLFVSMPAGYIDWSACGYLEKVSESVDKSGARSKYLHFDHPR
jgi:hypothetical protein